MWAQGPPPSPQAPPPSVEPDAAWEGLGPHTSEAAAWGAAAAPSWARRTCPIPRAARASRDYTRSHRKKSGRGKPSSVPYPGTRHGMRLASMSASSSRSRSPSPRRPRLTSPFGCSPSGLTRPRARCLAMGCTCAAPRTRARAPRPPFPCPARRTVRRPVASVGMLSARTPRHDKPGACWRRSSGCSLHASANMRPRSACRSSSRPSHRS